MKASTVLERAYELTKEDQKAQVLRGLSALLVTTDGKRVTARTFIQEAIDYIEKH